MDSCNFNTLFIKMLKHNIDAPFPNDGDLVGSQQVKVKSSLRHYAKKVLSHIVPVEACDILLEQP